MEILSLANNKIMECLLWNENLKSQYIELSNFILSIL